MSIHSLDQEGSISRARRDYLLQALAIEEAALGDAASELRAYEATFEAQQQKVAALRAAQSALEGEKAE